MIRRPPRSTLFPTRRSSDLNDSVLGLALGRCDRLRVRVQRQPRRGMPKRILLNLYIGSERAKDTDRKSTRLNSSHGYISYAVFCLKKKKKDKTSANLACVPH